MANPNIAAATAIYARSTGIALIPTGPTTVVSNAASSGKVLFLETLSVSNTDASNAVSVSVARWSSATPGATGATGVAICSGYSIPAGETLIVVSKDTAKVVTEDQSIAVTPGTAAKLDVSADYKEIS